MSYEQIKETVLTFAKSHTDFVIGVVAGFVAGALFF